MNKDSTGEIVLLEHSNHEVASFNNQNSTKNINPAAAYLLSLNSKTSRNTMTSYLNIIARMIGFNTLHDCDWASMRRHHVQMIIEMLQSSDKAPATVNTYIAAIKGVANEAWNLEQIDSEALQRIKTVKPVRGSRISSGRALPDNEVKALVSTCAADNTAKGLRDLALISVLIGCGLRRSEIVGLDFNSIDYDQQAFVVLGKGNKQRISFIPQSVWDNLQSWVDDCRGSHEGALFLRIRKGDDITEQRLTSQAIYHILYERQIEAGIRKCAPHDLRRTYATMLYQNGEDMLTIKESLGHTSIGTTERYVQFNKEKMRKAADRLIIG